MGFTNSPMVSKTFLSPNQYGSRISIIGITPHCYVGKATPESAGAWFGKPSTGASCNYYIDAEGTVTLIVNERSAAWTSSSETNDLRHVTIECASEVSSPYAFPIKTYEALIKLTADIYKRNGIKKAVWDPNGNAYSQISVHRWFKQKACPGDWMMDKLNSGDFCKRVNELLEGKKEEPVKPTQPESTAINNADVKYQAHTQTFGWLPEVRDGQISGTVGASKRLEAIKLTLPKGVSAKIRAHIQGIGWREYECVGGEPQIIGTTGQSKRIEAIEILKTSGIPDDKKLKVQAHAQTLGWNSDWTSIGVGTMGFSKRLEAIKFAIL